MPGILYISTGDETLEIGKLICDEFSETFKVNETVIDEPQNNALKSLHPVKEISFFSKLSRKSAKKMMIIFSGKYDMAISNCQNRRLLHLLKNSHKKRTRKKNLNRLFRLLEKQYKGEKDNSIIDKWNSVSTGYPLLINDIREGLKKALSDKEGSYV